MFLALFVKWALQTNKKKKVFEELAVGAKRLIVWRITLYQLKL